MKAARGASGLRFASCRTFTNDHRSASQHLDIRAVAYHAGHEAGVPDEVPPPQPPRLAGQAVRPLETPLLHPHRRLALRPGDEVERRAHGHERRRDPATFVACLLYTSPSPRD